MKRLTLLTVIFSIIFANYLICQQKSPSNSKDFVYPITDVDRKYIENIRRHIGNTNHSNPSIRTFQIIAYHDKNAGKVTLLSDEYFEIELDVLPIPYIGKYFKNITSIKEYARFYNVWKDSIHIQEEKRGTYFYKILPDSSYKLLKYYGNKRIRKRREGNIFPGADIISLINDRINSEKLDSINTFAFGYPYFGTVDDTGDSISLDPNKFYVVERNRIVPIIDDKNVPIKDVYIKFDDQGRVVEGGALIKKGFNTHVLIKEKLD